MLLKIKNLLYVICPIQRTCSPLSLYMEKTFIYLPIIIISFSLHLPTLPVLSSFLSLSRSSYTHSFCYGHPRFLVSFSSFPHLLLWQGIGFLIYSCFICFIEIRFDGFMNMLFFMLNVMYFDAISIFFYAFSMHVQDYEFFYSKFDAFRFLF